MPLITNVTPCSNLWKGAAFTLAGDGVGEGATFGAGDGLATGAGSGLAFGAGDGLAVGEGDTGDGDANGVGGVGISLFRLVGVSTDRSFELDRRFFVIFGVPGRSGVDTVSLNFD